MKALWELEIKLLMKGSNLSDKTLDTIFAKEWMRLMGLKF
jgi:hypothetical protein